MAVVVVQARMGSTRLPGKSLMALSGQTVIDWVIRRVVLAESVSCVVLATSTNQEDDPLAEHVLAQGIPVYRGHPLDVLDRYRGAVALTDDPIIVRITGDCPFVQPALIDLAVETLNGHDYVATGIDGRFPRGFDVEAMQRHTLLTAAVEAKDRLEREHVTPFIVRRPERFDIAPVQCPTWAQRPDLRITLDEPADLELLRAVVHEMRTNPEQLDGESLIGLLESRPDLVAINAHVTHNIVE